MSKARGGLDLDNVLALTQEQTFKEAQALGLLTNRKIDDATHYNLEEAFPGEISYQQIGDIFRTEGFWARIEPCPFLVDCARELRSRGVELHIVTARTTDFALGDMIKVTKDWLYFHNIPYDKLAFVPAERKAAYCVEKDLGFFVEDRLDTAMSIGRTFVTQSYLVVTPYNIRRAYEAPLITAMSRPYFQSLYRKHYFR
jgi:hypothetical protein